MNSNDIKFEVRKIWKKKTIVFANILGLATGISLFVIALVYCNYEWNYDKGFTGSERIYRVETTRSNGQTSFLYAQPVTASFQQNTPGIEGITRFYELPIVEHLLKADEKHEVYLKHLFYSDHTFFTLFDFPFLYGDARKALSSDKAIVLSKSTSIALFGRNDPLGRSITIGDEGAFIVTGVFDDIAIPSHLPVQAVRLMPAISGEGSAWNANYTYAYIKLNQLSHNDNISRMLTSIYKESMQNHSVNTNQSARDDASITLRPLREIYLHSGASDSISKKGNGNVLWLVQCIAVFVLLTSLINFINYNLAESIPRIKEIAIRRCIGAGVMSIVRQWYIGIFIKCLFSLLLAIVAALYIFPFFSAMLGEQLHFLDSINTEIWIELALLLLVLILLGGIYPVIYLNSVKFVSILKGAAAKGPKGAFVRNTFFVVQIVIVSIFIAGLFVIKNQIDYLRSSDPGFDGHQVLLLRPGKIQTQFQYPGIKQSLLQIPGVENVSYSSAVGIPNEATSVGITVSGEKVSTQYICVDTGYFRLLSTRFISGGTFSDSVNSIVINKTLAGTIKLKEAGMGSKITFFGKTVKVAGIIEDMNMYGFENKTGPVVFTPNHLTLTPFILIKTGSDQAISLISQLQSLWKEIEPGYPLRYQFLDESFEQHYTTYIKMNKIFNCFFLYAFIMALIGLFSLISLNIYQRAKEIAIRKVHGASVYNILKVLNKDFVKLIVLANVLAIPITVIMSTAWLHNFAYRAKLSPAPYIISSLLSTTVTLLIVSIQSLKAITINPFKALRKD